MSRHFMVVAGITIINATTPVSASAQICDGALSWLCQGPASWNREPASKDIQQDKARQRLPTRPGAEPERSHKPVSLAGRRLTPQHSDPHSLPSSEHPQRRSGLKLEEREALFQQFLEWRKNQPVDNP
jgi:hypothetical protein